MLILSKRKWIDRGQQNVVPNRQLTGPIAWHLALCWFIDRALSRNWSQCYAIVYCVGAFLSETCVSVGISSYQPNTMGMISIQMFTTFFK